MSGHWNADTTSYRMSRKQKPLWAITYCHKPGGEKNPDGTTSFFMRFPALVLTEYVANGEKIAADIARELNAFPHMVDALKAFEDAFNDLFAVGLPLSQGKQPVNCTKLNEASRLTGIALAKAEGRA